MSLDQILLRRWRLPGYAILRQGLVWYRHRHVRPADVFLGSFPRSGNTWVRFVLGEVLSGCDISFDSVRDAVPEIEFLGNFRGRLVGGGRLVKTHEPYRADYARAIYLVRDVRAVAASYYYYMTGRQGLREPIDTFVQRFVRGTVDGYGSWVVHVRSWLDSPPSRSGNLLVVRYEDLLHDSHAAFMRMISFLDIPATEAAVRGALERNELQAIRRKEQKAPPRERVGPTRSFVGEGREDAWRSVLLPSHEQALIEHASAVLGPLGYLHSDSGRG